MGRLRIRTLDKNMTAVAQATAGPPATADAVREALAAAKVTNGVDAAAIESFGGRLADAAFAGEAVVARGVPPIAG
ncbi:MAG: flagellar assembly protein A, partial [Planctomycetota bacterium]